MKLDWFSMRKPNVFYSKSDKIMAIFIKNFYQSILEFN